MADNMKYKGPQQSAPGQPGGGPGAPSSYGPSDPTLVSGQDPASFLGINYQGAYSTGAGGSPAPGGGVGDPTNEPNQYPAREPLSGVGLDGTGAPGTQGAPATQIEQPGAAVTVSDPNYTAGKPGGGSGTQFVSVPTPTSGPQDATMVAGQYPPAAPVVPGDFYPVSDNAGAGRVLVGGFLKGQRQGTGQRPAAGY